MKRNTRSNPDQQSRRAQPHEQFSQQGVPTHNIPLQQAQGTQTGQPLRGEQPQSRNLQSGPQASHEPVPAESGGRFNPPQSAQYGPYPAETRQAPPGNWQAQQVTSQQPQHQPASQAGAAPRQSRGQQAGGYQPTSQPVPGQFGPAQPAPQMSGAPQVQNQSPQQNAIGGVPQQPRGQELPQQPGTQGPPPQAGYQPEMMAQQGMSQQAPQQGMAQQAPQYASGQHPAAGRQRVPGPVIDAIDIDDIIQTDVVTAEVDTPVQELTVMMENEDVGSVVILDDEVPAGVVTDRKIALTLDKVDDLSEFTARDVISEEIFTGSTSMTMSEILDKMSMENIRRFPIVDENGVLQGIITLDDLLVLLGNELQKATDIIQAQSPRL